MGSQRILDNTQVNWFEGDVNRLSYQMIFDDQEFEEPVTEEQPVEEEIDVAALLEENNAEWQQKLDEAKEEYYQSGFDEGFEKGLAEARAELDAKLQVLAQALEAGQKKWEEQQNMLNSGMMEVAFSMAESILNVPVEDPAVSAHLEEKLGRLLQQVDEVTKPVLIISESDMEMIGQIVKEYAPNTTIVIRAEKQCNPGEFILETNEETLVFKFTEMLKEFKSTLNLPTWKA